jgi:uncharacterized protein (TIGR02001 family)
MITSKRFLAVLGAAAAAACVSTAGRADDAPSFTYSITAGGTSDYVFRGLSNNHEAPAAQGSIDVGYGIWYGGVWSSTNVEYAGIGKGWEVDVYTGIKPVLGPVTFDFGILGYLFPTANNDVFGRDANYMEFKAGASMTTICLRTISSRPGQSTRSKARSPIRCRKSPCSPRRYRARLDGRRASTMTT